MSKIFYHRLAEGFYGLNRIPGIAGYSKRALILAGQDDAVIVDWYAGMQWPPPELKLLNEQGIGPKPENVLAAKFENNLTWEANAARNKELVDRLKRFDADALLPFTGMAEICQKLAVELKIPIRSAPRKTCIWANSKVTFQEIGNELKVIPRGIGCKTKAEILEAWDELSSKPDFTGKAVVKAAQGASGMGSCMVDSKLGLERFLKNQDLEEWGGATLQEWIDSDIRSPSINYYLRPDGIKEFFMTDQIFESEARPGVEGTRVHRGNQFPTAFSPKVKSAIRKIANPFAKKFVEGGYFGPVGFDAIVTKEEKVYLVECNARVTGPHYGWRPMEKFEAKAFRLQNESFSRSISMEKLKEELGKLLFSPARAEGYIIFNKFPKKFTGVVLADSPEERDELAYRVDRRFERLRR